MKRAPRRPDTITTVIIDDPDRAPEITTPDATPLGDAFGELAVFLLEEADRKRLGRTDAQPDEEKGGGRGCGPPGSTT
jgi:hypothetical protein